MQARVLAKDKTGAITKEKGVRSSKQTYARQDVVFLSA